MDYIMDNFLDDKSVRAVINRSYPDEIFVQIPDHSGYFTSQYRRIISTHCHKIKLLKPGLGGKNRDYLCYNLSDKSKKNGTYTISAHLAVSKVFCSDFWTDDSNGVMEVHHIDGAHQNNFYRNLLPLPIKLHNKIHTISSMYLYRNGSIEYYQNLLDLMEVTGLGIEEILRGDKCEALGEYKGYYIFDIKGNIFLYRFFDDCNSLTYNERMQKLWKIF